MSDDKKPYTPDCIDYSLNGQKLYSPLVIAFNRHPIYLRRIGFKSEKSAVGYAKKVIKRFERMAQ
jgi:hypothetical protein